MPDDKPKPPVQKPHPRPTKPVKPPKPVKPKPKPGLEEEGELDTEETAVNG